MDTRHILSGSSFNKLPLKLRNDRRSTHTDKHGTTRSNNPSFFRRNSFTSSEIKFTKEKGKRGEDGERKRKKNNDRKKGGITRKAQKRLPIE